MERKRNCRRGAGEAGWTAAGGATLALTRETTKVALSSKHLEITTEREGGGEEKATVPLAAIGRVVVCGYPRITFPAVLRLASEGIPCFFLSEGGRWKASLQGACPGDARRRMLQFRRAEDRGFSLTVARSLVEAKVLNSRRVLQRLAANRGRTEEEGHLAACGALREAAEAARKAGTPEPLRGVEGAAAGAYFGRLSAFFPAAFPFRGRNRRPPKDAANALLSFAYGVLTGELEGAIRVHGLDPAVGHFHVPGARPALALDLLEPFRPAVADLVVLDLLNHGMLDPEAHFTHLPEGGVHLAPEGRRIFFVRYERAMARRFRPGNGRSSATFRQLAGQAVLDYVSALESGEIPEFFRLP